MCYLENFWPLAAFGVQSNTFSLSYANFFKENSLSFAQKGYICAFFYPFVCVTNTKNAKNG